MFGHRTRTATPQGPAFELPPVTTGDCAMCHATAMDVIPLGMYPGAPSQCADGTACLSRLDAIAGRRA